MAGYTKLVRDKIPDVLDGKGVPYEKWTASAREYKLELIKKLQEEAAEFAIEGSPEELADVMEVVDALRKLPEYRETSEIQNKKRSERGGFEKRIILKGEKKEATSSSSA